MYQKLEPTYLSKVSKVRTMKNVFLVIKSSKSRKKNLTFVTRHGQRDSGRDIGNEVGSGQVVYFTNVMGSRMNEEASLIGPFSWKQMCRTPRSIRT